MPHSSFKILPGVDVNKTPALNEAAVSSSQLIRFIPDRTLGGLVQKLGGWTRYFSGAIGSVVRALWAWEDTNNNSYLAVGAEGNNGRSLLVIKSGAATDITPQKDSYDVPVNVSTVAGDYTVTITDVGSNVTDYDVVDIQTQISIGGLILFGQYQCYFLDANNYIIHATDLSGNLQNATLTVNNSGSVPRFDTTIDSNFVTVTLADHYYAAGDVFPVLVSTSVGGINLYGNYIVQSTPAPTTNTFVIAGNTLATSTTFGYLNSGDARYVYYRGVGALPSGSGYGAGGYGSGGYGTGTAPVIVPGTPISAVDWTLDNWGETLMACPLGGPIYEWSPISGSPLSLIIPQAPPVNQGVFVAMPQRQLVAWGSTFTGVSDPLLIRWCDVNDYNSWISTLTNQAGSYRIPKGSKIVQCIQAGQQALIWTDLGIWAMQYVGPPYAYQFNELGTGCGLVGRKAAGTVSGVVYWMGASQFYRLAGGGIEPIKCPIWDVVFQDLDINNMDKIRVAPNSRFGEISWYYPTNGNGGEINAYVKYNYVLQQWDYGELSRTAWINESVLGPPIGAGVLPGGSGNYIIQHETSLDAVNSSGLPIAMNSSFQTGYFVLDEADHKMFVDQIWPDMRWGYYGGSQNANVLITFYVADYAGQTPSTYGPYTLTQATTFVTTRFRGRLVSIKVESNDIGSFWRLGNIRYRFQQDGKY